MELKLYVAGILQEKRLYVLFSGTVMLVLASLAVPSLTLVCVFVRVVVWAWYFICRVIKFEGGAVVDRVLRHLYLRKCVCFAV